MDWSKHQPDWGGSFSRWLDYLGGIVTEPRALFWWPTLLAALLGAAAVVYFARKQSGMGGGKTQGTRAAASTRPPGLKPFLRELPVDAACVLGYTYTLVLMAPILLGITIAATTLVFLATGITTLGGRPATFGDHVLVAGLIFVFADFCLYWSHRLFHLARPLWLVHVLHHRPPVLTPLTAFRFWPPEAAVHFAAFSFGEGIAIGVAAVALGTAVTPLSYVGVNAFLAAWYVAFSHLRHSHVPLYFPRWLSFILVSPHMHQVHHSLDPRHHHSNFGTALAVWDRAFGTLYIPEPRERFEFGVVVAKQNEGVALNPVDPEGLQRKGSMG